MTKWWFIFVMPLRENKNRASDWLSLLTRNCAMYLFSSYQNFQRKLLQVFSKSFLESAQRYLFIQCALPKTRKPNLFQIPFCDQSTMTVMNLFKHVWWTECLYLGICFWLKWVGSDNILESVLCLNDYLCNI